MLQWFCARLWCLSLFTPPPTFPLLCRVRTLVFLFPLFAIGFVDQLLIVPDAAVDRLQANAIEDSWDLVLAQVSCMPLTSISLPGCCDVGYDVKRTLGKSAGRISGKPGCAEGLQV